jgi:periplasmic mercuric ion binding protein
MKSIKLTLVLLVATGTIFLSCKNESSDIKNESKVASSIVASKAEKTTFNIEGMTCAMGCAKTIETKLSSLEGVQKATVDFEKKTATVEYDAAKQSPEKIVEVVEAVADGQTYKVSNVKSSADKAMLYQEKQDQEKDKKAVKKSKKDKKVADEASVSATTSTSKEGEKKAGCCAGKKSCSAEKPSVL